MLCQTSAMLRCLQTAARCQQADGQAPGYFQKQSKKCELFPPFYIGIDSIFIVKKMLKNIKNNSRRPSWAVTTSLLVAFFIFSGQLLVCKLAQISINEGGRSYHFLLCFFRWPDRLPATGGSFSAVARAAALNLANSPLDATDFSCPFSKASSHSLSS